jgi:trimeric autotransporter adhesin
MVVLDNGNVGIGTTSPTDKLQVALGSISIDNNFSYRQKTSSGGNVGLIYIDNSNLMGIYDGKVTITSTGNAGIGTTSPQSLLHLSSTAPILSFTDTNSFTDPLDRFLIRANQNNGLIQWYDDSTSTTSDLMAFLSTGNVGIGTTNPGEKLHVDGALKVSNGGNTYLKVDHGNVGFIQFTDTSITAPNQFLIQHNYSQDNDFRISRFTGGRDFVINSGGNVGIWTTTPTSRLQVKGSGTTSATTAFRVENANVNGDKSFVAVGNMKFETWDGSAYGERLRITAAGNVGIGTTSPLQKLHLKDGTDVNLQVGAVSGELQLKSTNDADSAYIPMILRASEFNILNGNVGIGTTTPTSRLQVKGPGTTSATTAFRVENANASGSMVVLDNGNVGIGTTNPVKDLQIGAGSFSYVSQRGIGIAATQTPGISIRDTDNNVEWDVEVGSSSAKMGMQSNHPLFLITNNTTNATITAAGNVGIGTTTPFSRLTTLGALSATTSQISIVNSEGGHTILRTGIAGITNSGFSLISANVDGTNQNTRLVISSAGNVGIGTTTPTSRLQVKGSGTTSATTAFRVENANASTSMVVLDNGRVGIGTTSPNASLHISGANATNIAYLEAPRAGFKFYTDSTSTYTTTFGMDDTGLDIGHDSSLRSINLRTNNQDRLTVLGNGNVGIGTANPAEKLHVYGGVSAIKIDSTTNEASLKYDNSTTTATIKLANNDLKTELGGSERMRILANGNVGIGTTAPTSRLQVKGSGTTSATTAFRVENANASVQWLC